MALLSYYWPNTEAKEVGMASALAGTEDGGGKEKEKNDEPLRVVSSEADENAKEGSWNNA